MATIVEPDHLYEPEDLLSLSGDGNFELVDGHLVEQSVSVLTGIVAGNLSALLGGHVVPTQVGYILSSDTMHRYFPDHPERIRKPDLCFVRRDRLNAPQIAAGFLTIAPDLAVEIVSPNDEAEGLELKLLDYLDAGIPLIWVIYPIARTAVVYRAGGTASRLRAHDELQGEDVIPGFSCRLDALFPTLPESTSDPDPTP
jgi:Uma2 family endonuclease